MGSGVDPDTILQLDQLGAISDHTCGHRVAQLAIDAEPILREEGVEIPLFW